MAFAGSAVPPRSTQAEIDNSRRRWRRDTQDGRNSCQRVELPWREVNIGDAVAVCRGIGRESEVLEGFSRTGKIFHSLRRRRAGRKIRVRGLRLQLDEFLLFDFRTRPSRSSAPYR